MLTVSPVTADLDKACAARTNRYTLRKRHALVPLIHPPALVPAMRSQENDA